MNRTGYAAMSLILALAMVTRWARAGIEGSKHDFSRTEWSADDRCGACHLPHRTQLPKEAPLWEPQADLSRRFAGVSEARRSPGRGTRACLRCHDGTVAPDTVASLTARQTANKQHPALFTAAAHQSTDHPVGVDYPTNKKGFRPANMVTSEGAVRLPDGKVECVSCHDQHNTAGVPRMLVKSNRRSALCLTCHQK